MAFRKWEVRDSLNGPDFEGEYPGMDVYMAAEVYAMEIESLVDLTNGRVIDVREKGKDKVYKIKIRTWVQTRYEANDATEGDDE